MARQIDYLKLYADSLDKNIFTLTSEEKDARFYVTRDKELRDIAKKLSEIKDKNARQAEIEKYFSEKENKVKEAEKVKEAISKTFGIDLNSIDFMKLESGIDAIAFYDKDLNRKRIIDYTYAKNLTSEFTNIQNKDKNFQTDDYEKNSVEIAKKEAFENDGKRELEMIDIERFKKEYNDLIKRVDDPLKVQNIKKIVQEADLRNIKYINIENMVGLDEDNNIVESYYDQKNHRSYIESPVNYKSSVDYVDNKENVDSEVYKEGEEQSNLDQNSDMSNENDDSIDITPSDFEQEEDVDLAEKIDLYREMKLCDVYGSKEEIIGNIKKYYNDPSLLDKDLVDGRISQKEYDFYENMNKNYKKYLSKKKTKTLTLQSNETGLGNAAYVNIIFVSIILLFLAFILLINR